ncbi:MAG: phosphoesterase PA-phosphatase [Sphingobacteriaceae bacterium]|nr:phosphoesterase PA-phosphatase [Sphingobacteriaceae bacterium]
MKKLLVIIFLTIQFCGQSQSLDFSMLRAINKDEHPQWDKTMKITSNSVYPALVVAPTSLLLTGYVQDDKIMMRNGVKTGVAIGLNVLLTTGLKYSINRKRPYEQYPNDIVKRTDSGPYSFPSGHTSSAFAAATAITLSTKKWYVAVPSYAYACAVGYSRMRLGVHFPSDVLGGMIIGIGSSLLVFQVDKWLQKK